MSAAIESYDELKARIGERPDPLPFCDEASFMGMTPLKRSRETVRVLERNVACSEWDLQVFKWDRDAETVAQEKMGQPLPNSRTGASALIAATEKLIASLRERIASEKAKWPKEQQ